MEKDILFWMLLILSIILVFLIVCCFCRIFKSKFKDNSKYKHQPKLVILLIIAILILLFLTPFLINESYKKGGYITLWSVDSLLSLYGSCLELVGALVIGFIAISLSVKSNELSKKITDLETKDRKTFIIIDTSKNLEIFFIDNENLFTNKCKERNLEFEAIFSHDGLKKDFVLVEFYINNISNNFAIGIYLEKFEIELGLEDKIMTSLECDANNSFLLKPNTSQKVLLKIVGLNHFLKEESINENPIQYFDNGIDLKFIIKTENLFQETTTVELGVFLDKANYNRKLKSNTYKISNTEYKELN